MVYNKDVKSVIKNQEQNQTISDRRQTDGHVKNAAQTEIM